MSNLLNRRQILKGAGAVGGLAATGIVSSVAAGAPAKADVPIKSPEELSVAEKLMDVHYTPAERAQIFDTLEEAVDRIRLRRAHVKLTEHDVPALIFDPRLPGRTYAAQENKVTLAGGKPGALPKRDEDIAFAPLTALSHWVHTGQITSARLTEIYLKRIDRYAGELECFVTLTADLARAQAKQADAELKASHDRGPLHGIPYVLKDLFDTKDILTTWGAAPYRDRVPKDDAAVTSRLREAGAVLLGKSTMGALAWGDKWFGGVTRNPWNRDEGSSGSSAGSAAATAAGLCGFSIGTETYGSIVSPSSRCGVTGLKPSFGRVPRTGAMPLCWSLDKVGTLCRGVEDTPLVIAALNGPDGKDPYAIDMGFAYDGPAMKDADITLGYDPAWFEAEATDADRAALKTLKGLGFRFKKISLPDLPYKTLLTNLEVEAAAAFEELTLSDRDDLLVSQQTNAWPTLFRAARFHSAVESLQLDRFRRQVMVMMADIYKDVDVIVCPNWNDDILVISNYTGYPSLTLPTAMEKRETKLLTGTKADGPRPIRSVPHAITLWGNLFREDQLLAVGRKLEAAAGFAKNRPAL
ncbi:amidase [Kordiimonas marina]|uniref:amidase n=1 Tax=Kordiimonas marina TaxID=2872312 RepID=UPI001FF6D182|nr:amidase [Kordiimonas marina]MCJ9428149.1 amidase [Kordiimonas marina]